MAYNGSGVFVRLYNWVNDRDADVAITSTRMDAEDDGFATGLSNCVTADGQTTTTAVIPFAAGVSLYDGLVGTPAVRFTSDTNTGYYRKGADNVAFSCQGIDVLELNGAASSAATGVTITSAAAASGVNIAARSSGTNESLNINAKGSGTINLNPTGTGDVVTTRRIRPATDGETGLGSTTYGFAQLCLSASGVISWADSEATISRNGGGDTITFAGASGGWSFGTATVKAPSFTVEGLSAPNNGLYLPSVNTVGIAADSTQVATVTSSGINLVKKLNFGTPTELTIISGAITITRAYHTVDTESDAASDDLDTVNGGAIGDIVILTSAATARTVVLKHGTGNVRLSGGTDRSLDHVRDSIILLHNGSEWIQVSGNGNVP
jgi:hypothetical protein